ncbi:MAG: S9 family peptidase [Armatimonadetes bacterium]|nr:S9 family peptidase [Armatimonadota bacterium]
MRSRIAWSIAAVLCCAAGWGDAADDAALRAEGYIRPPKMIEQAVLAPWHNNIGGGSLNPQNTWLLVTVGDGMPPIERVGTPHVNLGGTQIDTVAERDRSLTMRSSSGLALIELATQKRVDVSLPKGVRVSGARWSPDGSKVAFIGLETSKSSLYVVEAASGKSKKVCDGLRLTEVTSFDWLADSKRIVVPLAVNGVKMPTAPAIATGPRVRLSDSKPDQFPTYPDLLNDPDEITLLKYYLTAQIGVVDTDRGSVQRVGEPMMIADLDAGPGAKGFLVRKYEGEFSYIRPASSGAQKQVLLDAAGKEVAVISYSGNRASPIKKDDQPPQRSGLAWRPDGAGLSYVRDEELPKDSKDKPKKQLVLWKAPFGKDDIEVVFQSADAFNLVGYGSDGKSVFISKPAGKKTDYLVFQMGTQGDPKKFWETNADADFYSQPGSLMFDSRPGIGRLVRQSSDGGSVFLAGTQYFKNPLEEAPRPFVDRLALDGSMKPERIWQSSSDVYETADLLDDGKSWLINRQSPTLVNQLIWLSAGTETTLTNNQNFVPDVTLAERKRIKVKRDDGVEFWIEATFPRGIPAENLPAFIWFYPTEYTDQKTYDESGRTYNKNLFRRTATSTVQLLVLEGYVVVDADFPITGEISEANNTFPHQLRMNFTAIVDALAEQCGVDRKRMSIGGHSYGAFGTANALVHTSFFRAGIAGDGNYNRTLTPFGFQREGRDLWRGREVYVNMSAMLFANQINGALLMYHGMEDQNVGTNPINSERMFAALEALGKPSAMYMYPYEDHGQIGLETRLDMWARWVAWLNKWVKNPEPPTTDAKPPEGNPPPRP